MPQAHAVHQIFSVFSAHMAVIRGPSPVTTLGVAHRSVDHERNQEP